MKTFSVEQLVTELKKAAQNSPSGEKTLVCIDDSEGNTGAFGLVQSLDVFYDEEVSRLTILFDRHDNLALRNNGSCPL